MREIWKNIAGYEEYYQISNNGKVKSLYRIDCRGQTRNEKILKPGDASGYLMVILSKNRKKRPFKIHRLVLYAFIGKPQKGMVARHLDGNRLNNRLDNLCWGTASENQLDRKIHGTDSIGENNGKSKITETQVIKIRKLKEKYKLSYKKISDQENIPYGIVLNIFSGKSWSHVK